MANYASEKPAQTTAGNLTRLYVGNRNDPLWDDTRERLYALGVDSAAEEKVRERRFGFLFAMGQVSLNGPGGLFDHDEDGQWQCVIPELWDSEVIDLVTFPLDAPHRMACLRGVAAMLGEYEVERSAYVEGTAVLWDDPVQWLKAGGEGGVLLDRMRPPVFLADPKLVITTASHELAIALRIAFTQPTPMPQLLVREGDGK